MRILYLTQWFEPEPAFKGLSFAKALSERGHYIEVVTGFPNYPAGKVYPGYRVSMYRRETMGGVAVHRLPLYPSHDGSTLGRTLNYLSFFISAAVFATFHARRFDVIYAYPPVTVGLAAVVARILRGTPVILDIQDLWPDSVVASGMPATRKMAPLLNRLCNFVYRRAARIISQSRGIKTRLIERGVPPKKVDVIYNWADEKAATPAGLCNTDAYGFAGHFNIVYGGNLGRVQGLDTLIRAAHLAQERVPQIQLLLIGDGVEADNLRVLVREIGAENIRVEHGVPQTFIGDVFAAADVLILHLRDHPLFAITIPSKTQFYMAMGKPVLIGVRGEAAEIITSAGAGRAVPPDNIQAMADAMVEMANTPPPILVEMGRRAAEAYRHEFSFSSAITATVASLNRAVADACAKDAAVSATNRHYP